MRIHWGLLRWFFRQTWPLNGAAMAIMLVAPFAPNDDSTLSNLGAVGLFAVLLIHPLGLVAMLGRYRSKEMAFLYTRGFSRNGLWGHLMLFTAVSIFLVWFPACLVSVTPFPEWLYGFVEIQGAPYLLPPTLFLRVMLIRIPYPLLLPAFHYAWIRQAQPGKNSEAGFWIALAVVWGGVGSQRFQISVPSFRIAWLAVGLLLLVWGCYLHRSVEVRS